MRKLILISLLLSACSENLVKDKESYNDSTSVLSENILILNKTENILHET